MTIREEFERLADLGAGAHGRVFAARHRASGRAVAIKSLNEHVPPRTRERFAREARVRIESPHVLRVLDVRFEGEAAYLILELAEGGSAEDRLARGPLPLGEVVRLGAQVARALEAAHEAGYVHRDVKPANILFTADGVAKLGDFGIAKADGQSLTGTGEGMGTLAYLAPEQAADAKRVSPRADLYALGATLYHLAAGKPPLDTAGEGFVLRLFEEEPPPLQSLRPDCPPPLADLIHRMLEKDPHDRPPNAASVARRLEALEGQLPD